MIDRYAPPSAGELSDDQQRVADAITGGMRGEIPGPLAMWLLRPELADRAQRLGEYARYQTCLAPALSEIAILAVARFWGSEFEWNAHKRIALAAGVSPQAIESIRSRQTPAWESLAQETVYEFAKALLEERCVNDDLFEQAIGTLGQDGVVDLVGILGYYSLISMTINVFDVPLPEGAAPELSP
jgi:4-carboxymuconolactone decarboxylase